MPLDTLARSLVRIAIAAGGPVASVYFRGCPTRWKADGSPVTEADLAAERLILERLAAAFPGIPASNLSYSRPRESADFRTPRIRNGSKIRLMTAMMS